MHHVCIQAISTEFCALSILIIRFFVDNITSLLPDSANRNLFIINTAVLTSASVSLDVFHASNGRVITVGDKGRHSVQQTVHVAGGTRIAKLLLQSTQAPHAVLVLHLLHPEPCLWRPLPLRLNATEHSPNYCSVGKYCSHHDTSTIMHYFITSVMPSILNNYHLMNNLCFIVEKFSCLRPRMTADKGGSHNKAYAHLQTQPIC